MDFSTSLAYSIAFSSGISVKRLIKLPDSRFKPYSQKIKKAYYKAKSRFERTSIDHPERDQIRFNYEIAYSRWSDLLKAQDARKK